MTQTIFEIIESRQIIICALISFIISSMTFGISCVTLDEVLKKESMLTYYIGLLSSIESTDPNTNNIMDANRFLTDYKKNYDIHIFSQMLKLDERQNNENRLDNPLKFPSGADEKFPDSFRNFKMNTLLEPLIVLKISSGLSLASSLLLIIVSLISLALKEEKSLLLANIFNGTSLLASFSIILKNGIPSTFIQMQLFYSFITVSTLLSFTIVVILLVNTNCFNFIDGVKNMEENEEKIEQAEEEELKDSSSNNPRNSSSNNSNNNMQIEKTITV